MENNDVIPQMEVTRSRPAFLSVLCILSFIGGSLWALVSLAGLVAPEWCIRFIYGIVRNQGPKPEEALEPFQAEMLKGMEEVFLVGMIEQSKMYVMIGSACSLLLAIISIIGVAKMWQLSRWGFWLYLAANLISISGMIYFESWVSSGFVVLFILLYSLNFKHLK
jgi:hypothetical protein